MAIEAQLGGSGTLFVGEDKTLRLHVKEKENPDDAEPTIPVDISGWLIHFEVRKKDASPDPPALTKTASIIGVYNVDPTANTHRAVVTLSDDDTNAMTLGKSTEDVPYRYAWKRMDDGSETVLRYGDLVAEVSTVR